MTGASIETTLELWASSLRDVKARMRDLFTQERVAASANLFLDGLLGDERRKTGWMRAEAAGDPGPWRQQAILGRGRWDADGLRATLCGSMLSKTLAHRTPFWSLMRPGSSSRARHPVVLRVNIPARRARSQTVRLGCSPPMYRHRAMPLSIVRFICPRVGPAIQQGWLPHTFPRPSPSPPNRLWLSI